MGTTPAPVGNRLTSAQYNLHTMSLRDHGTGTGFFDFLVQPPGDDLIHPIANGCRSAPQMLNLKGMKDECALAPTAPAVESTPVFRCP